MEEIYWRENFADRPYMDDKYSFDDYGPAYRHGWDSYARYEGKTFDQVEPELMHDWDRTKGQFRLSWNEAKHAARDSWQRVSDAVERAVPGDSDRDGK